MTDKSGFPETIAAKQADVVIMVLGDTACNLERKK
jgi:hypothetical protein